MNIDSLKSRLILDEGKRNRFYLDTKGIPTIGIGHNLNIPISDRAIDIIFEDDLNEVFKNLDESLPWWRNLDDVRQEALADMCFNLGIEKLLGFAHTLSAWKNGDYPMAADFLKDSLWAKQVGARAQRIYHMVKFGQRP